MGRGGKRPGAGRKPGSITKLASEAYKQAEATGIMPREYLLELMRDTKQEDEVRRDCAKALLPYFYPKLSAIEHSGEVDTNGDRPQELQQTILGYGVPPTASRTDRTTPQTDA